MTPRRVSVVLMTCNGADTLPSLLAGLHRQRFPEAFEIVAVDSGSTDGTLELLQQHAVRVRVIDRADFDHGLTRNLGVSLATGSLIVFLVQDAEPASDTWLQQLVLPLDRDPRLAGAFARQVPRPDASAIARESLAHWIASRLDGRVVAIDGPDALAALTPFERLDRCAFDNVCSCIRRSVWEQHPFRATPIGEDVAWARDVLLAGHRIAYVPEAAVIHSHDRSIAYEFRRTRALHARLFELFGLRTIPTAAHLASAIPITFAMHLRWERSPSRWPRASGLAIAWPLAQYLGGRDAARRAGGATQDQPCES